MFSLGDLGTMSKGASMRSWAKRRTTGPAVGSALCSARRIFPGPAVARSTWATWV